MTSGRTGPGLDAEDRAALVDLVHRYAARVDDRDPAGVAELFVDDGVLASPAPPRALDPVHEAVGHDGVRDAMAQLSRLRLTVHAVGGVVLDPDGPDGARGRVTATAHHVSDRDGEPVDLVWHLRYLDRYRRTGAGWRFARRELHVDLVESRPVALAREAAHPGASS